MERWQTQHIIDNLPELIRLVKCDTLFLADIQSHGVLSDEDLSKVESKQVPFDKARCLLDVLRTRTKGYAAILRASLITCQQGVLDVLITGIPQYRLQKLYMNFGGKTFQLGNILSSTQISELWSEVQSKVSSSELVEFSLRIEDVKDCFNVLNDTIPQPLSYYIPRTLSRRLILNAKIFTQISKDIFVIDGMERYKLTELASPNRTAYSRDQLNCVTVRFIYLEDREDWENIRSCAPQPAHLLKYDNVTEVFVLEDTSGASKILCHFLEQRNGDTNCTIPEKKFTDDIEKFQTRGICICDLPGMGKTLLLANLAHKANKSNDKIVAFVRLQVLLETMSIKYHDMSNLCAKKVLFEYIARCSVAAHILMKIVDTGEIKVEIFLDGFDEIGDDNLNWTKNFLKSLTLISNMRIYVTSRPHMRHELEQSLGVIAYDILPFNEGNQVYFVAHYLAKQFTTIDFDKLESFAKVILQKFKESVSPTERDIAGIPLQCKLIAELGSKHVLRHCRPGFEVSVTSEVIFGNSMFEMFRSFIDAKFTLENEPKTSVKTYSVKPVLENVSFSKSNQLKLIKQHHHILALHEIFPEFGKSIMDRSALHNFNKREEIFSCGLLEEVYNGESFTWHFIHRTMAEYLAAEFFAIQLIACDESYIAHQSEQPNKKFIEFVLTFLFKDVFKIHKKDFPFLSNIAKELWRPRQYFFCFSHSTVMYFFGHLIKHVPSDIYLHTINPFACSPIQRQFCSVIESCGYHNFVNIFSFIENIYKQCPDNFKLSVSNENLWHMASVICEYSSPELVYKCIEFLQTFFSFNQDDIMTICTKNNWVSPLQYACIRRSYDLLEYFLGISCSPKNQCLIHFCVIGSADDSQDEVQKRIDVINMLLVADSNLINETDRFGKTPVFPWKSHLALTKFLFCKGANIFTTDEYGGTIAHLAAEWMCTNTFHELVDYILENENAGYIFEMKNHEGNTPLHVAFSSVKNIRVDTINIILSKTTIAIDERDDYGESFLFGAVKARQDVEILKHLIGKGANFNATNNEEQNLLHIAAHKGTFETVVYLKSIGIDLDKNDKKEKTPFQLAKLRSAWNEHDKFANKKIIEILRPA